MATADHECWGILEVFDTEGVASRLVELASLQEIIVGRTAQVSTPRCSVG